MLDSEVLTSREGAREPKGPQKLVIFYVAATTHLNIHLAQPLSPTVRTSSHIAARFLGVQERWNLPEALADL